MIWKAVTHCIQYSNFWPAQPVELVTNLCGGVRNCGEFVRGEYRTRGAFAVGGLLEASLAYIPKKRYNEGQWREKAPYQ